MKVNNNYELYSKCIYLMGSWNNDWREKLIKLLPESIPYFESKDSKWVDSIFAYDDSLLKIYVIDEEKVKFIRFLDALIESFSHSEKLIFCSLTPFPRKRVLFLEKLICRRGGTVCRSLDDIADEIKKTFNQ